MVAIDGPAGAGKSTVAARIAARFGLLNLETGAMYRAFALKAIQTDSDVDDREELGRLALKTRIRLLPAALGNRVFLDDVEVTKRIREADVTAAASRVSVHPGIRQWMVSMQRQLGADSGVVMEGRDIGTKVFPDAEVKIFLDAAAEVRGQRRYQQNGPNAPHCGRIRAAGAARARPARPHPRRITATTRGRRGDHRFHRSLARRGGGTGRSHHHRTARCPSLTGSLPAY